jgi:spermidine/putrescine transport system ATP-binding protein
VLGDSAVIKVADGGRIEVPLRAGLTVTAGTRIELTVRPEKIRMRATPPDGGGSALRGTVREVVYLGTATNYTVTTVTGDDIVVFTQNATSAEDIAARGDSVWLSWEPRHSYAIGATS